MQCNIFTLLREKLSEKLKVKSSGAQVPSGVQGKTPGDSLGIPFPEAEAFIFINASQLFFTAKTKCKVDYVHIYTNVTQKSKKNSFQHRFSARGID